MLKNITYLMKARSPHELYNHIEDTDFFQVFYESLKNVYEYVVLRYKIFKKL